LSSFNLFKLSVEHFPMCIMLIPVFVAGVMERQLEMLEKEFEQGKKMMKEQYDHQKLAVTHGQKMEVQRISKDLHMRGCDRQQMYMVGKDMRARHNLQMQSLADTYQIKVDQWEDMYYGRRQALEAEVEEERPQSPSDVHGR